MAITGFYFLFSYLLLPCYKRQKNVQFTKKLEAVTRNVLFAKISLNQMHFVLVFVLEQPLCQETNKRKISYSLATIAYVWRSTNAKYIPVLYTFITAVKTAVFWFNIVILIYFLIHDLLIQENRSDGTIIT